MYNIDYIKEIHLEITSKCQAKCPMCPRRWHGGKINPHLIESEIDLDTFKKWLPENFIKQLKHLYMCGNYGDPIIAKDTLEIFKYLKETNPNITLAMYTNGSARTVSWWKELAQHNVRVIFGIDGTSETHSLYRVGTDFHTILRNAEEFINAGGEAEWHMLVFEHNQHEVELCHSISKKLGFKQFVTKHTSRFIDKEFDVKNEQDEILYKLYPTNVSEKISDLLAREYNQPFDITCKAVSHKQLYIGADGTVTPCCWLDLNYSGKKSKEDFLKKIGLFPNLNTQTIKEIFDSGYFDKIEKTWKINCLSECARQCGKYDKLKLQFKNV